MSGFRTEIVMALHYSVYQKQVNSKCRLKYYLYSFISLLIFLSHLYEIRVKQVGKFVAKPYSRSSTKVLAYFE